MPPDVRNRIAARFRRRFPGRAFGNDDFLVSVAFHVLLAIVAGDGQQGGRAKAFGQKLKTRQTDVKLLPRFGRRDATYPETGGKKHCPVVRVADGLPPTTTGGRAYPPHIENGEIFRAVPVRHLPRRS